MNMLEFCSVYATSNLFLVLLRGADHLLAQQLFITSCSAHSHQKPQFGIGLYPHHISSYLGFDFFLYTENTLSHVRWSLLRRLLIALCFGTPWEDLIYEGCVRGRLQERIPSLHILAGAKLMLRAFRQGGFYPEE